LNQNVALSAGSAYRLKADIVSAEFRRGRELPRLMLRYTAALIAQIAQTTVCNRFHSTEQQFCRFILVCLDRLPSRELAVTQHLIADMLGVRRESVTEAAGHLQKAGAIQYRRGHVAVVDRKPLEALACECYALDRNVYESLVRPKGIVDDAGTKGDSGSTLIR
jgi:CRP-like cAMP-binding protein